jgi:hypothetical protein
VRSRRSVKTQVR